MEQTAKAQMTTGAMDREVVEDEYDFVFDDSVKIAFALDTESGIAGTMDGKDAALQAQIDEAERRGEFFLAFYLILHHLGPRPLTFLSLTRYSSINRPSP